MRIVDLTMGWAGPLGTLLLADLGAEVIKIEGPGRLDWWRGGSVSSPNPDMSDLEQRMWERSPVFSGVNRNKRELVVDMKRPEGRALFEQLVTVSDAVVESFSPRVLQGWGLGYERLRELNERIILMSLPAVGSDGPWSHYVGYASTTEAMAGLPALCGYDGDGPILQTPSIADPLAGLNGAVALAMALYDREVTGPGAAHRGRAPGGRHPADRRGLHGLRHERARARAARQRRSDGRAERLLPLRRRRSLGRGLRRHATTSGPALAGVDRPAGARLDARFATREARVANVGEVEAIVAAWTSQRSPREAMDALQAGGVIAAALNNEADLLDDPQVRGRGRLRDDRPRARRPAPVPEHHRAAVGDAGRGPPARADLRAGQPLRAAARCWGSRSR